MKVLITGATGFVGSNLIAYITRMVDFQIYGMVRNQEQAKRVKLSFVDEIVTTQEVLENFHYDVVIHLAGKAHDVKRVANEEDYYISNELLTIHLYDAFLNYPKSRKFIFISSMSVFSSGSRNPLTENDTPNPATPYGTSKYNAECYIRQENIPEGKKYYILRPSIIYGPRSKGNLNLLFNFIYKGYPYPLGAFKNQKTFLSVKNLCFVITKICSENITGGTYHISDNESLSTLQVINIIYDTIKKKPKILHVPKFIIKLLARIGDRYKILIDSERLNKLTQNFMVSNKKILKELAVNLPVKTNDGLKKTFKYYEKKIKRDK